MSKKLRNLRKIGENRWTDGYEIFDFPEVDALDVYLIKETKLRLLFLDSSYKITSTDLAAWVVGVVDEVNVADDGDGTITLSLPNAIKLKGATASRLLSTDADKLTASVAALSAWVAGTTGRLTVTDNGDGTVTLDVTESGLDHGSLAGIGDDDHSQYHNDARADTWLADGHETTFAHGEIGDNSAHRALTSGNPHQVAASDLVTAGAPQSGTYTFGGGGPGDVASMTFSNGILSAVTVVP